MVKVAPIDASGDAAETVPGGRQVSFAETTPPEGRRRPSTDSKADSGREGSKDSRRSSRSSGGRKPSKEKSNSVVHNVREQVRDVYVKTGWFDSAAVSAVRTTLYSKWFTFLAIIALFVALFFSDLFVLCQVATNTELDIILTLCLVIFAIEFIGLSLTDASYLLGFFFWMDLLGTVSMVADLSYMLGSDATQPYLVSVGDAEGSASDNIIVVRAARAAKLGARAGRLSRVLKLLRFIRQWLLNTEEDPRSVKMAKVISNQLNNVLSTRVAFLCIAIVVTLPLFTLFTYPVLDDSMGAWTELLGRNAEDWKTANAGANATLRQVADLQLRSELQRLSDFYKDFSYGPFDVCYGERVDGKFVCRNDVLDLSSSFSTPFAAPARHSSIREVSEVLLQVSFDMSTPKQQEAVAGMSTIIFVIVVMCVFGMVMSNSISTIALKPLERMLKVVRERCKEIFKYIKDAEETDEKDEEDEKYDDTEHASEFMLLEMVVTKLAAIANLSKADEPEVTENMNEDDIMKLNWMQGASTAKTATKAVVKTESVKEVDDKERSSVLTRALNDLPDHADELLEQDEYSPFECSKAENISVVAYLFMVADGVSDEARANIQEPTLVSFIQKVEAGYFDNPFHNFAHGVDVLASVVNNMRLIGGSEFIPEASQYWLMVASLGHDIGHLGVNNQYLVETSHELALKYNDRSPMENMHCATLFQVTSQEDCNVFGHVDRAVYKEMRTGIITAILHTDMTKHGEMIKELGLLYQMNSEAFDQMTPGTVVSGSQANMQLILNALLHSADISNPMKPWDVCRLQADRCLDEFFAQGDKEKELGIPVQMLNDREKVNRPNSQIGFIEFVIAPICGAVVNIFPQLDHLAENLGVNIVNWYDVWVEKHSPAEEDAAKVNTRVQKVAGRCQDLMRAVRFQS